MEYQIIPVEVSAPRYLDEFQSSSMAYEGFYDDGERIQHIDNCINNVCAPPCWDIIAVHPSSLPENFAAGGYFDISPGMFLGFSIMYHYWEPYNNIWLWSCRAGSNGMAQLVANISGFEVKAPMETLTCMDNGFYFVSDLPLQEIDNIVNSGKEREIFNEKQQADKWQIFIQMTH